MKCLYCGSTEKVHKEHLVPKSRGGLSVEGNLFRACKSCNSSKNDRLPSEWRTDLPAEVYELEKVALKLHSTILPRSRNTKIPKNVVINVRCTEDQKDLLDAISSSDGMGVSTWLLFMGLRTARERQQRTAMGAR